LNFIKKITLFTYTILPLIFFGKISYAQLQFIQNKGQWDKAIDFKSDIGTGAFFLQKNGFTVVLHNPKDLQNYADRMHGTIKTDSTQFHFIYKKNKQLKLNNTSQLTPLNNTGDSIRSHAYRVSFVGASSTVEAQPDKDLPTYNNYFIGNDKTKWQSNCKIYQGVTYKNMYPNIDVRYYTDMGTLKYDLIVHPGGNINDIALKNEGADKLQIKNKELIISTSVGDVKELYPYTYQVDNATTTVLDCKYILKGDIIKFKVEDYSPTATVIIDPTLIFSSLTGSTSDNWGYTATPGPDGSFFAGGISFGTGYPVSLGAYDQKFNGGRKDPDNHPYDVAIIKFSPKGTDRLYATYLGGADGDEQPHSMVCDKQGNLIVAGRTNSTDFPTTLNLVKNFGGTEIFVTKFNASGSALIGSVLIGGSGDNGVNIKGKYDKLPNYTGQTNGAYDTRRNYGDDARSEVILDGDNNILLASCTQSDDFPVTAGALQSVRAGGSQANAMDTIKQDGVIIKFTPDLTGLLFSTYFGGPGNDACFSLSISPTNGNIYIAGATTSSTLPGTGGSSVDAAISTTNLGGATDGFITEILPTGTAIVKTIFVGTPGNDMVYGIQFDKLGFPYIMGATTGNWPVKKAAFSNPGGKQFIAKLQPDLSAFVYSTIFGTNSSVPNISPVAFLVDRCQNVYVSGWGGGQFFTDLGYPGAGTRGLPVTANAIQPGTDGQDFYFFILEKNANSQLFGSFYGQAGGFPDHVDGGTSRFDENGIIYQAICANCGGRTTALFPTTPGVWAPFNGGGGCNEAAVKIEMNFGGIGASVKATINGVFDTVGCVPLTIQFLDTLKKGKMYIWDYGDLTYHKRDTTFAPNNNTSHTYYQIGTFRLMLISVDSSTCNISDTAYIDVKVGNNQVSPNFTASKIPPCTNLSYNFTNTTTAVKLNLNNKSFIWDFGDGTRLPATGLGSQQHTYASVGTYNVTLLVNDTTYCNSPDSVTKQVRLAVNVKAKFSTPLKGCAPYNAVFKNTSLGGTDFKWDFGDGTTSTDVNPVHPYPNIGTYFVKLIAYDTSTCNKIDSTTTTITVYAIPTSSFTASPNPGPVNTPTQFTNASTGASNYIWNFGDGQTSTDINPLYQYISSGTFNVCLQAINPAGCIDTFCLSVTARINPLLDVPNAFTPGKFGKNAVIKVEGFGIGKMSWRIYNRWGQLVFQSANKSDGWDGTFKGTLQPTDVYSYTLEVIFSDGKKYKKTGDITLLR